MEQDELSALRRKLDKSEKERNDLRQSTDVLETKVHTRTHTHIHTHTHTHTHTPLLTHAM